MNELFRFKSTFNEDIRGWDVSKVTNMVAMFQGSAFNRAIGSWDVSKVTNMGNVFKDASAFNEPIGSWDVSEVTDMRYMFDGATAFSQDLSTWCVEKIASEPTNFAVGSPLALNTALLPLWNNATVASCLA